MKVLNISIFFAIKEHISIVFGSKWVESRVLFQFDGDTNWISTFDWKVEFQLHKLLERTGRRYVYRELSQ